jgi:hypothetical protein
VMRKVVVVVLGRWPRLVRAPACELCSVLRVVVLLLLNCCWCIHVAGVSCRACGGRGVVAGGGVARGGGVCVRAKCVWRVLNVPCVQCGGQCGVWPMA